MGNVLVGIIGGSGLGRALAAQAGENHLAHTPFGSPSGPIVRTRWHDVEVAILQRHGPGHLFPPSGVPFRANIYALKQVGVTHIIASGATGSLRENIRPGDLVIVDQLIDKTQRRASTFYDNAAVHVEMAQPFCPVMRRWLIEAARSVPGIAVHSEGTYVCMEGPAFSTFAESHMHRAWGGDLIGMTACPEAKLAREAEMAYALIAMPTDYDCWRPHEPDTPPQQLLSQISANLESATGRCAQLIKAALRDVSSLDQPSPAHDALRLAIWSDKAAIDRQQVQRLDLLWGRYF